MQTDRKIVEDVGTLRTGYAMPSERVANKVLPRLGKHMREFIALSPFVVVATAGPDGKVDASPRGDFPGFVRVVDDQTLHLPDRPGNNRIDSSHNLVSVPGIGMLFFVPGVNETLRINGRARITFDEELRQENAHDGKLPRAVWIVAIEEAYFHCGKALIRSDIWNPEKKIERSSFASYAQINADLFGADVKELDTYFEDNYRNKLY
jgi:uncharacterized protein